MADTLNQTQDQQQALHTARRVEAAVAEVRRLRAALKYGPWPKTRQRTNRHLKKLAEALEVTLGDHLLGKTTSDVESTLSHITELSVCASRSMTKERLRALGDSAKAIRGGLG